MCLYLIYYDEIKLTASIRRDIITQGHHCHYILGYTARSNIHIRIYIRRIIFRYRRFITSRFNELGQSQCENFTRNRIFELFFFIMRRCEWVSEFLKSWFGHDIMHSTGKWRTGSWWMYVQKQLERLENIVNFLKWWYTVNTVS